MSPIRPSPLHLLLLRLYALALPFIEYYLVETYKGFSGIFLMVAASLLGVRSGIIAATYATFVYIGIFLINPGQLNFESLIGSMAAFFTIGAGVGWIVDQKQIQERSLYQEKGRLKEMEFALKETEQRLGEIINFLPDATFAIDHERKVIAWNRAMEELTGVYAQHIVGEGNYAYALPFYGERKPTLIDLALKPKGNTGKTFYYAQRAEDNSLYGDQFYPNIGEGGAYLWAKASPLFNTNGEIIGAIESLRDITQIKQYEQKLKYLSFHDSLTNLYNRAYFEEELKRLDTRRQLPISIIIGDVNNLKLVNDTLGHQEGDKLLIQIASFIKASCREEDIACRWGGDEFMVLLPGTDEKTAWKICMRITSLCEEAKELPFPVSISLGVDTKTRPQVDMQKVIKEAEDRMYRNKVLDNKGLRNSIVLSLQRLLEEKTEETIEHALRLKGYALGIGGKLALPKSEMDALALLCSLHDIGKIAIPDSIIMKLDKLSEEEWEIMKKHSEIGNQITRGVPELAHISDKILSHHEWWDGTGYPQGLCKEEIPLLSRIVAIVDAYDVMTNGRQYKKKLTRQQAIGELKKYSGKHFDPQLVELFLEMLMPEMKAV